MDIELNFSRYDIPERFQIQLEGYILRGETPSSFLSGVLSGDIRSILVADIEAYASYKSIVRFLDNELPSYMWGDTEKFNNHIDLHVGPERSDGKTSL